MAPNQSVVNPVLVADRLSKRYGRAPAVQDVTFAIWPGQILGFLGPNGSGKSTTVKMITGLLQPTTGTVLYRGVSIFAEPLPYKRQLGYVPEEAQLYGFLSGLEYLEFVAGLREMAIAPFEAKAAALLDAFGLFAHRFTPLAAYSKGMRQRVMLIAALLHDPEVLVLDEPFSELDVMTSLVVQGVLQLLAQAGKAIFFSSPVIEMFEKVCTHVLLLRQGSVVRYGTVEEITSSGWRGNLESAFITRAEDFDASQIARNIVSAVSSS